MSALTVIPVVGTRYRLGDEVVEVVEALKKRYWRIRVAHPYQDGSGYGTARTIPQAEWAAKARAL